ncbi:hypothetical protein [Legionella cincinnatiensis]|uniref:Opacity protein and related surface antigens n=1 Tax=Legionella cincinnatiensis TaxID=28085 RepID=A0A378IE31_9GAMM|nr:hypothetical protein [Legionella cincinnatiensis]KTC92227.1 hypothetical protein Lcin_1006 [Legionella cincinnatiensis]STX33469.1 Uncharacterised protein [Legionella cincinnatiensis]
MEVKLSKLVVPLCVFIFPSLGYANQISFFVSGGPNFSILKNKSRVEINEVITNAYQTNTKTNWQGFWAVGANHTFEKSWFSFYQLSLGIAGYFFELGQVKGTEFPFINEGFFDTLNYNFHAKSSSLMVEGKAIYSKYVLKPYVLVGIGPSWNRFYTYHEKPTEPSLSAAPAVHFNNHTKETFSYELGAGLDYLLWNDTQHQLQYHASVGYQYFNLDKGALGYSLVQTSKDRLTVKNLYTQGIVFTLAVSFG